LTHPQGAVLSGGPEAQGVVGDSSLCLSWHPFGHSSFVTRSIGLDNPSISTRIVRVGIIGEPHAGHLPGVRSVCRPRVGLIWEPYNRRLDSREAFTRPDTTNDARLTWGPSSTRHLVEATTGCTGRASDRSMVAEQRLTRRGRCYKPVTSKPR
jgi:hypothetical protein